MSFLKAKTALHCHATPAKAGILQSFFKTGPGQYGEGDIFIGVKVPEIRAVAKEFKGLPLKDILEFLHSPIHEERLLALLILIFQYEESNAKERKKIVGMYLKNTAIVSTFAFIREQQLDDTFKIAHILLQDKEDLIHKAVGWMLREAGKRNEKGLKEFLKPHLKTMPRTMLRYAIEKFPPEERLKFLHTGR
jgi:hypothetical protein